MDSNLDLKVVLNENPESSLLGKWCLDEYDSNDKKVAGDYIPWPWSCYFKSDQLRVVRQLELNRYDKNYELLDKPRSDYKVYLVGDLRSGRSDEDSFLDRVSYSMFGTNRKITKFNLYIGSASEQDGLHDCKIYGIPSYDSEDSHSRRQTVDDYFGIDVFISEDELKDIAQAVESKSADSIVLRISRVSGFYSYWSPEITTSHIKILTSYHTITKPKGSTISPHLVGTADEFWISLTKKSENNLDLEPHTEIAENKPEKTDREDLASLANSVDSLRAITNSLKRPLWLIFIALLIVILSI
jgi:hypothetical protein